MKKLFILPALFFYLVIALPNTHAHCEQNDEEQLVRDFYIWYIKERINLKKPLQNDEIYNYVYHCTVNNVHIGNLRGFRDADYFTRAQDIWERWIDVLEVHKATKIDNTTSIVPISFKFTENSLNHLVIFVQRGKEGWRITKVVDTYHFSE